MPVSFPTALSAAVVMSDKEAQKRGLKPLGIYRGFEVAGCHLTRWGSAPCSPCRGFLKKHNLKIEDIGIWELNEAFAVQGHLLPRQARHSMGAPQRRRRRDLIGILTA